MKRITGPDFPSWKTDDAADEPVIVVSPVPSHTSGPTPAEVELLRRLHAGLHVMAFARPGGEVWAFCGDVRLPLPTLARAFTRGLVSEREVSATASVYELTKAGRDVIEDAAVRAALGPAGRGGR